MKAKRFTAIFFLGVLAVFMCLVFAAISIKAAEMLNISSEAINIDWEKLYPFNESSDHSIQQEMSKFAYLKDKIEKSTTTRIAGSFKIIEAAKTYEELIGWNMAAVNDYNPVVRLDDGFLVSLLPSKDISENAQAVAELDNFCRTLGIKYMYINAPIKICSSDDKDISGILDYSNQNTDRFLDAIGKAGVKYYDFRKILHADGMNHHEAFFKTDHHWKPETGLWAARHILEFLRDDYGWDVDPEILNPDKFEYKVYPEWFLGSYGKKITLARTKPDDFTIIYPKFHTHLRFEVPSLGIDTSGDFSVTYNISLAERRDYYGLNTYAAYKYADLSLGKIHNLLSHDGRKILFVHGSIFNCVIPFTALGIEYTEEIDLRHFTGSLKSYIKTSRPDIVITAYNSTTIGFTKAAKYPNNKFYDFR